MVLVGGGGGGGLVAVMVGGGDACLDGGDLVRDDERGEGVLGSRVARRRELVCLDRAAEGAPGAEGGGHDVDVVLERLVVLEGGELAAVEVEQLGLHLGRQPRARLGGKLEAKGEVVDVV